MTFIIARDGTIRCLHTETIDLAALGSLHVQRASTVEHHARRGLWEVRVRGRVLFSHALRSRCLAWEQQHDHRILALYAQAKKTRHRHGTPHEGRARVVSRRLRDRRR